MDIAGLSLPAELVIDFRSRGFNSVESVYGAMVAAPEELSFHLSSFGVEYNELRLEIRRILRAEEIQRLETPAKKFPLGAMPVDLPAPGTELKVYRRKTP